MGLCRVLCGANKITIINHTALDKQRVPLVSALFVLLNRAQIRLSLSQDRVKNLLLFGKRYSSSKLPP